jgi:hypothetical protein
MQNHTISTIFPTLLICQQSCNSCQSYTDPQLNILYQCIIENTDSNIILIISIICGVLVTLLIVIILTIKLKRKPKFQTVIKTEEKPIETKAVIQLIEINESNKADIVSSKRINSNRILQPQQILNKLMKEKSKPVSEEILCGEKLCVLTGNSIENTPKNSIQGSPHRKKLLLKNNYKQLKQREISQFGRAHEAETNRVDHFTG